MWYICNNMDTASLHGIFLIIHLFGVVLGAGGAFMSDGIFFTSLKDKILSKDEFRILGTASNFIWGGLLMLVISGIGLFTQDIEALSSSEKFISKMTVVGIIILNGIIFHVVHLPFLKRHLDKKLASKTEPSSSRLTPLILASGVISVVSWTSAVILGALRSFSYSYPTFLSVYVLIIGFGILTTLVLFFAYLDQRNKKVLVMIGVGILTLGIILGLISFYSQKSIIDSKNPIPGSNAEIFTMENVAKHNTSEDCWLIIDNKVFDATPASKVHPALFNCGTDASINYHKNHGKGISDKMMVFYIGDLGGNISSKTEKEEKTKSYAELNPKKELYVPSMSWNPDELMVVVEKDAEKLLFIDGKTHTEIGRIHDIGFQPHTSVFSSDKKYMYIISRDGWLSKIDITTLDPVISIRVGENSRGTALTDDDKFLAIGNYEPHNVVIVDTETMLVVETIKTSGEIDNEITGSRVGVVVESEHDFIIALKDVNSVWVIEQNADKKWVVKNKYPNIGNNKAPLHDGFLTPDGKFFVVAAQGANSVWVLNTQTWKVFGEVPTGKLPHTGPGAVWKNTTYIPALEEGLITAIDMTTWKPIASIKTGGPGLFVRSYSKNPEYPYVWADTAFGEHKDEIYVIDARVNKIVKTLFPVEGKNSWHPEFTYDGKFVYVVSQEGGEVMVYDAYTFEVVKRIKANTPSAVSNVGLRIEEPGL